MSNEPGNGPEETPGAEVEGIPASEQISRYSPYTDDWDKLAGEADTVFGYDLAKDEIADALTGVVFLATSATFRPGISRDIIVKGEKVRKQFAYVSLENVIAPVQNITRINMARDASGLSKLEDLAQLPFDLGGHVLLNDGSTGVYRQIVQYLTAKQVIIPVNGPITEQGPIGESTFDLPPTDWYNTGGMLQYDPAGNYAARYNIRLRCPRGLRLSKYENDFTAPGEQATTRYLG